MRRYPSSTRQHRFGHQLHLFIDFRTVKLCRTFCYISNLFPVKSSKEAFPCHHIILVATAKVANGYYQTKINP